MMAIDDGSIETMRRDERRCMRNIRIGLYNARPEEDVESEMHTIWLVCSLLL